MATTFVNAGGSLVLQVLAARTLGAAGYGGFALCSTVLTLVAALQTGWVGDSLTVLDRRDRGVRAALLVSHLAFMAVGSGAAVVTMLAFGLGGLRGVAAFALLIPLWLTEEVARRILMARQEFWKLVLNDSVYVGITLLSLAGWTATGHGVSITSFLVVMSTGAAAAIVLVLWQLPADELVLGNFSREGALSVLEFATWRSAQAGVRPLGLFVTRVLVAGLASRAVLGEVEAGRLLLAPAITFLNGIASFLLPFYTRRHQQEGRIEPRLLITVVTGLVALVAVVGVVATVFVEPLTQLLTSGKFTISRTVVLGWTAFTVAYAAGMPCATALVAQRRSRLVFQLRMADLLIGIALVVLVTALGKPLVAPAAVAVGALVGTALLFAEALKSSGDPSSGVPPVASVSGGGRRLPAPPAAQRTQPPRRPRPCPRPRPSPRPRQGSDAPPAREGGRGVPDC